MAKFNNSNFGSGQQPPTEPPEEDPIVGMKDLPRFGICYSRTHIRRMIKAGKFPEPFLLTPNRLAWRRSVIFEWIDKREKSDERKSEREKAYEREKADKREKAKASKREKAEASKSEEAKASKSEKLDDE